MTCTLEVIFFQIIDFSSLPHCKSLKTPKLVLGDLQSLPVRIWEWWGSNPEVTGCPLTPTPELLV